MLAHCEHRVTIISKALNVAKSLIVLTFIIMDIKTVLAVKWSMKGEWARVPVV